MITHEVVYKELKTALRSKNDDEIRSYSRQVCTDFDALGRSHTATREKSSGFRKIFITLVIIAKPESIVEFIDEGVNDLELPLTLELDIDQHHGTLKAKKLPEILNCCEGWSPLNIHNFHDYQWTTLAPFFGEKDKDEDAPHYILPDQITLPFTEHTAIAKRGGFGQVYKTRIHTQHHNFHDHTNGDDLFAVKSLDSTDKDTFTREVEIMKQLSKKNQKHLLPLLASYEQSDRFYLIFPWAESDLCEYWEDLNPDPLFNQANVKWVAEQCQGIAYGLSRIHQWDSTQTRLRRPSNFKDIMGYHGDIKPANILWFKDDNVLKLSDFGLSDFDTRHTRSRRPRANPCASPTYRAPEWDSPQGSVAGRSYDIWGLGCVFLEFITWLVGGWKLVDEFSKNRPSVDYGWERISTDCFFTTENPGTYGSHHVVKPAVTDWFQKLRGLPHCSEFVKDFLNLIENDMMVVIDGNKTKVQQRLDVRQVAAVLTEMAKRCSSDESYACCPAATPVDALQVFNGSDRKLAAV
ncbi:hypothetical protein G7054_g965 [Neopestalotiopsis clavispora]|nr:hypothetical protein G7054_g965 [Neopestalotiopsis clavispora]